MSVYGGLKTNSWLYDILMDTKLTLKLDSKRLMTRDAITLYAVSFFIWGKNIDRVLYRNSRKSIIQKCWMHISQLRVLAF